MGSRGVHFAITRPQMADILKLATNRRDDPDERDDAVQEYVSEIEEKWEEDFLFETDKAWDGIHRCLTEDNTPKGKLNSRKGKPPLKWCILGGRRVYTGLEYSMSLVTPERVPLVAKALKGIDEDWMRERFFRLTEKATLYPISEDEFEYTWGNFRGMPEFFAKAARRKRAVIFTVDH